MAWKKGQSGNPKGRARELPDLKELLSEVLNGKDENGKTKARNILDKLAEDAAKGDKRAAEILFDRSYGKPKQEIDIQSKGHVLGMDIEWDKIPPDKINEFLKYIGRGSKKAASGTQG